MTGPALSPHQRTIVAWVIAIPGLSLQRLCRVAGQSEYLFRRRVEVLEQRPDEALSLMRAAAQAEETSDKHPVTPGNVVPSRELLGEMLLELGQPAEAFDEFERSLRRDPNRLKSLQGAAQAAHDAGKEDASQRYQAQIKTLVAERDTVRPDLVPVLRAAALVGKR